MCEFDDIRFYDDNEVIVAIQRIINNSNFQKVVTSITNYEEWKNVKTLLASCKTISDFQQKIIIKFIKKITYTTSNGISYCGIENVQKDIPYTFISNHRNIILDASILSLILVKEGMRTVGIATGDNLLIDPWIEDIVRLNKGFIVKRSPDFNEILNTAIHLSKYIHFINKTKKESIWISQREGRAKDSNDKTQGSILKMLSMNPKFHFKENILKLNIIPISISYEYDPCDFLKAKEFQQKLENAKFKKTKKDDFENMEKGLFGYKGKIHFQFGKLINSLLKKSEIEYSKNKFILTCCNLIDREIFLNYKFFPINYIAYDILYSQNRFKKKYTDNDLKNFQAYLNKQLKKINLINKDIPFLTEKILKSYAFPLENQLKTKGK